MRSRATNVGPLAEKFKKPYFYPVMAQGVSVTRGLADGGQAQRGRTIIRIIRITPGFISRMARSWKRLLEQNPDRSQKSEDFGWSGLRPSDH